MILLLESPALQAVQGPVVLAVLVGRHGLASWFPL